MIFIYLQLCINQRVFHHFLFGYRFGKPSRLGSKFLLERGWFFISYIQQGQLFIRQCYISNFILDKNFT